MPEGIRPTQNKVRKALFDILGDIEGLSFLELFAGSGGIAFEAASKGAGRITLVESNRDCLLVISKNMASLGIESGNLYPFEAEKAVKSFHKDGRKFDIIFLDPPYYKLNSLSPTVTPRVDGNCAGVPLSAAKKTLQMLGAYDILAPNGFVIVQHFKKDVLPDKADNLARFKQANYRDTVLSFYAKG